MKAAPSGQAAHTLAEEPLRQEPVPWHLAGEVEGVSADAGAGEGEGREGDRVRG